jgi:cytochrome b561
MMYAMMFAMPLIVGKCWRQRANPIIWNRCICGRSFRTMRGSMAILRKTHTNVAYLFFLTFIAHFSAVLFHSKSLLYDIVDIGII